MKIKEIIIESRGRELGICKLGEILVTVNGDGAVEGYPITGKFFELACRIMDKEGLEVSLDAADVLSEILASVAEGELV